MKETEQTLLDQIQNDVAKEKVHVLWEDLTPIGRSRCWPIVCERYAEAKAKASCEATLKKASENAIIKTLSPCVDGCVKAMACSGRCTESYPVVVKSSITDPSNIVIV